MTLNTASSDIHVILSLKEKGVTDIRRFQPAGRCDSWIGPISANSMDSRLFLCLAGNQMEWEGRQLIDPICKYDAVF